MLVQQTAAAAQSSATYGFNAGLQLDIAASKTDSSLDATSSVASTINGNNINIVTGSNNANGPGQSGNTLIQGSALNANQNLNIFTGELNVLASQDTMRSETDTQSGSMTIAQTVWGAAGGPTVSASLNSSQQQDKQTTNTNSSLTAENLNIVTSGDANIIGGNLHGATAVNMDIGGDLTLESVQDRFSGSNKGFGISGGMSLGGVFTNKNGATANSKEVKTTQLGATNGVSGVNGGVNAQSGRYQTTETVLSSITGGTVNIDVNGHTQLTGALIAALDKEGNDTGNLSLNTGSLSFTDLNNRSYSSNQSLGVSGSVGVSDAANPADPNQSNTDLALNSSNYSYQNESSQSLDKALATIGQGSITVGGDETSPEGLNRDVDAINKDIYDVDRQQGNIDLTVDHRLLTEEGRKQIAEDAEEIRQKGQVAYILLTEDASTVRDIKTSAIDDSGMSWGDAKELVNRDDVQAVAEAADKFNDALVWSSESDVTEPAIQQSDIEEVDSSNSLEIVINGGVDGKLKSVVDVAGDVAEKLEQVDPRIVTVVELGLVAAQGAKAAAQYIAEKVLENTAVGEAWAEFTQSAGIAVSNAATGHDAESRAWAAENEGSQQHVNHMDKGGTLLAGIALGAAGSGGIAAAIKGVGKKVDSPKISVQDHYEHHLNMVDDVKDQLTTQGYRVSEKEVSFGSSCGTGRCRPDIIAEASDGTIRIIEIKTGNADLSIRQTEIFPQIENGNSIPRGKVAKDFGLIPNVPLKDQGYPNGIPIEVINFPGAGG